MKIVSWNVNGIRAVHQKGFKKNIHDINPDILCLQEVKAFPDQLAPEVRDIPGYVATWHPAKRPGYSGVATFTRAAPVSTRLSLGVNVFDIEGRVVISEFDRFVLFNIYFPNGQKDDDRLQYKMDFYDTFLEVANRYVRDGQHVIVCGDVNTAHREIDLTHPKANEKYSGFLPMERAWIDKFISNGYVDVFRHYEQGPEHYTWWSYRQNARQKNVGWRIDYFFVSKGFLPETLACYHLPEVMGSDHCPVVLEIK